MVTLAQQQEIGASGRDNTVMHSTIPGQPVPPPNFHLVSKTLFSKKKLSYGVREQLEEA